ncbi:MAG: ComF family protein [Spirochaetia bacterium]|nr:ComF family protein [Spirochaetota bacterium]MCX8097126.1 ComF family protein [Spirochaetota bacterium]MDW8112105.1 ComF family protein [Spirochaetia bacterium]
MRLFLDSYCINCGAELEYRNINIGICSKCISNISKINIQNACRKCGLPDSRDNCYFCQNHKLIVKRNISLFTYEGIIRDLIYDIKFDNQKDKVRTLNAITDDVMLDEIFEDEIDLVVPVPTSLKSLLKRGFDLVKLVFKPITKSNRKPFLNLLGRKLLHKEQKKLSKEEREKLVREQFYIRKLTNLTHKNVLIVDDVFTTGSTINACANLIMSLKPKSLYSLTLVRVLES